MVPVYARIMAATAFAGCAAVASGQSAAPQSRDGDRIVCRTISKAGTRVTTKLCRSRAQWEALAEAARLTGKDMFDRPSTWVNTDREEPN